MLRKAMAEGRPIAGVFNSLCYNTAIAIVFTRSGRVIVFDPTERLANWIAAALGASPVVTGVPAAAKSTAQAVAFDGAETLNALYACLSRLFPAQADVPELNQFVCTL
jgi:hypothetical protein